MRLAALVLLACSTAAACGGGGNDTTVRVLAAASLTDAYEELGDAFEQDNPGVSIEFNFAASSALREQILAGAPADVYASANEENMEQVVEANAAATDPKPFARNHLEIAVPKGNPGEVTGLADFAKSDLLIGLCDAAVPCGQFGRDALVNAGVDPSIDTNEPDVRSLLTKLEAGELDAGIVYRSDVLAAGDKVEGIPLPADQNVTAVYPIVALTDANDPKRAHAFVDFVSSRQGQTILAAHGFDPP